MPTSLARPRSRRASVAAAVGSLCGLTALAIVVGSCGDDPMQRTEERYCTEVGNHLAQLSSPVLATTADVDAALEAWRTVSRSAPVAVQAEWETVVAAMETAAAVDPNDPASLQRAADQARQSEPAANLILTYTLSKCGAAIGAAPTP